MPGGHKRVLAGSQAFNERFDTVGPGGRSQEQITRFLVRPNVYVPGLPGKDCAKSRKACRGVVLCQFHCRFLG
jgi:hypothetical protein